MQYATYASGQFAALITHFLAISICISAEPAMAAEQPDKPLSNAAQALPDPLVYLSRIDPTIIQDIRYASYDNFTGAPVPGYTAPECILTARTAEALSSAQKQLTKKGMSLKVYDCYRPIRAVAAFLRWTNTTSNEPRSTERFHPALPRNRLVKLGYIAARSGHSRGHAVDITVVSLPRRNTESFNPENTYGPCTGDIASRAPDDSLDMGTGFDCFDVRSYTDASNISEPQIKNRLSLLNAMTRAGFVSYHREWWHYSFPPGDPGREFDIDVTAHN